MHAKSLVSFGLRTLFLALGLATPLLTGCSGGGSKTADALSGKVTLNGQPVVKALIVVIGADRKQAAGTTDEKGFYSVDNPPRGKCQVMITSSTPPAPKGGVAVPPPAASGPQGTPVPPKYSNPNNGLTVDIKGGKQTEDFTLQP